MTFEWPSWVDPLPFPFPELHNIVPFTEYNSWLFWSALLQIGLITVEPSEWWEYFPCTMANFDIAEAN